LEIIRHLVEKLPVIVTPNWVKTLAQPICIDDVIAYLNAALSLEPSKNLTVYIGVPPTTFLEMMRQTVMAGLRRWIMPVRAVPEYTPELLLADAGDARAL
jgi:uncharacterized protein YbjT (DUF2867 family)